MTERRGDTKVDEGSDPWGPTPDAEEGSYPTRPTPDHERGSDPASSVEPLLPLTKESDK